MSPRAEGGRDPSLEVEHACFSAGATVVIGVDEVGRGAIAGPVAVGVHAVDAGTREFPAGLRDSKLLSEARRVELAPRVVSWGDGAVGYASAAEIDAHGIVASLGMAARRALRLLRTAGIDPARALILLDGTHDWLSAAAEGPLEVRTVAGGDRRCASIAAASVRAKVARDALMREAHEESPHYGWNSNKGYGATVHRAGIAEFGLTALHRRSWIR